MSKDQVLKEYDDTFNEMVLQRKALTDIQAKLDEKKEAAAAALSRDLLDVWMQFEKQLSKQGSLYKTFSKIEAILEKLHELDPGYPNKMSSSDNPYHIEAFNSDRCQHVLKLLRSGFLGYRVPFSKTMRKIWDNTRQAGSPLFGVFD